MVVPMAEAGYRGSGAGSETSVVLCSFQAHSRKSWYERPASPGSAICELKKDGPSGHLWFHGHMPQGAEHG